MLAGLLQPVRRLVITELMRGGIKYFKGEAGFQPCGGLRERFEFVRGGHHRLIAIDLALFALRICPDFWEEAGPVIVIMDGGI
ncbi:MAG: hypothetical protein ACE5D4_10805 [Thermodesulfobacteriota bacterium]